MRASSSLLITTALTVACLAQTRALAQVAAAPPVTAPKAAIAHAGTQAGPAGVSRHARAQPARHPPSRHAPTPRAAAAAHGSAQSGKSAGVLALGATDITGNKELPKVMVIVPWKPSSGAGGVIQPTDSLLDEALEPVDRGVFQRRIRYYGQLEPMDGPAASRSESHAREPAPARQSVQSVAPVGDSR